MWTKENEAKVKCVTGVVSCSDYTSKAFKYYNHKITAVTQFQHTDSKLQYCK